MSEKDARDDTPAKSANTRKAERDAALAARLRANLQRRKAAQRARQTPDAAKKPD